MVKKLAGTFSQIGKCRALVIGDLILDTYTVGKARRISPEAPVAVVQVHHEENRPGGAGNVVLNLTALGADVVCVGRVGHDAAGPVLIQALQAEQTDTRGILAEQGFQTPVKNRIIAEGQQIVRVDHEQAKPLSEQLEQQIIEMLPELFKGVQVVAISDYGKGFLTRTLLSAVIDFANTQQIPVIADPKGVDFTKYCGVTILKPNLGEVYAAANLGNDASLEKVAARVLDISQADLLMVTRSEEGITVFDQAHHRLDFPVRPREIKDVTGAGDTVLAMLTCAVANKIDLPEAVELCNIAAGIAIERFGCARITLPELAQRMLEDNVENKVFDEEHIFALQQVLAVKPTTLLGLSQTGTLTPSLFAAIKKLKGSLLIYVRDETPNPDFINLLASLRDVDFILVNADSVRTLCERIAFKEVYLFEEDKLLELSDVTALF